MSILKKSILFLIIANIIWGASFPIYKLVLTQIPPFTFVFLRFFISALILLPFVYKHLHIKIKDIPVLILLSISGITLCISFINLGLKITSSLNAPIIQSASPIVLIISSFFYLKEIPKKKLVLGTIISFIGVLLIVILPLLVSKWDSSVSGNLFLVFATIFSVIHVLLLKKILPSYSFVTITFWSFIIGSLPLIPLVNTELIQYNWSNHFSLPVILALLFSIIFATLIAHSLSTFGIKYIAASEVGIFSYVDPLATIIVAALLLNEIISPLYVVASILVFGGIFIAEGRIHYHPFHRLFRKENILPLTE
jgi:drug/metabolite transporter (DMT)-like permease